MNDIEHSPAGPGRTGGRGPGRPPKIDRAAIARVASEIPLSDLTLRLVAERLGVSVPSLYHYVRGRDDLLKLAAEQSVTRLSLPVDRGQHWAVWFCEWAYYIREAFVRDPGLFAQYVKGAISLEVMAEPVNTALGLCLRQGFSPEEARRAYDLVSECALGAAVTRLRDRNRPFEPELRRVLARGDRDLPHLERLAAGPSLLEPAPFTEQIHTVLAGIAVRRGEDWTELSALLEAVPGD
ncbi:TetR/AcrR family transcriptional regulator [Actinocorallia populi]|uniref:TetR/AcrR family transcriptional regulator n=1 Tax=Actinocorallia populi TaxID=2079200 RepID=UPI0018E5A758|nr:TetR/AcrR family transcriptional regulator [Actinocorallia populi]